MNAHVGPSLGSLCRRGHDHESTGRSLRGPKGECLACVRQNNRERAKRREELRAKWARAQGDVPFVRAPNYDAEPVDARPYHAERTLDPQWVPSEGPLTLEECGARMGVTRERVRQIEAAALRKLRRRFGWLVEFLLPTVDPQARGVRR